MKRILFSVLIMFIVVVITEKATAQESINEGKVVYEISYPDMELDNQMASSLPTESTVYFKESWSRTEMPMAMGMTSAVIVNSRSNEVTTLLDMMGVKTATVMANEATGKNQDKKNNTDLKFELVDDSKTISGYPCKKAIMKNSDGTTIEMYYTDKIQSKSQFSSQWEGFKGFPMEYMIDLGGMNMKMTAKTVSKEKVPDELFKIPSDYKIMTKEEFTKMMNGGEK